MQCPDDGRETTAEIREIAVLRTDRERGRISCDDQSPSDVVREAPRAGSLGLARRRHAGAHEQGDLLDLLLVHVWEEVEAPVLERGDAVERLEPRPERVANLSERLDEWGARQPVTADGS